MPSSLPSSSPTFISSEYGVFCGKETDEIAPDTWRQL